MVGYILEIALKVEEIDRVIVSIENTKNSAGVGGFGAEVPFLRPKELAEDSILHFLFYNTL